MVIARARERERALGTSVLFRHMDGLLWDEQRRSYDFAETLHRFIWKSCDVIISYWKKSDLVRILVQKPNR